MAVNDKLLKAQQLQRTQELIRDVNFDNAISLPSAVGAENTRNIPSGSRHSNSWLINRYQDSIQKNDMTLIGSSLRDITDILDYRYKISGEKNPLYNFFENLRNRAERGGRVDWGEFVNAINTFSADAANITTLQDQINNTRLAAETEGETGEDLSTEEPSNVIPFPQEEGKPEEELPIEQPHEETGPGTTPVTPKRPQPPSPQEKPPSPYKKTTEEQQDLKERMRKSQQPKPSDAERPKNALPERRNSPISSKTRKKAIPRTLRTSPAATKLGAATPSSGGLLGGLNNYLGLRDLVKAGQWAAQKLGQQWLSNLLQKFFTPEKLLGQALRGLANIGAQLGRQALGALARGAANLLSRLAFQAIGRLAIGLLASPIVILLVIAGIIAIFIIWNEYEQNKECGQDGKPVLTKVANQCVLGQEDCQVKFGDQIEYKITISYQIKCPGTYDAEVRDTIPSNATYVEGSATGPNLLQGPSALGGLTTYEGSREGNTLIWRLRGFPNNVPIDLTFKTKPNQDNSWVINEASSKFTVYPKVGVGTVPSGGDEPPSADNCQGKYRLNSPFRNFGDPSCNFKKDDLYAQLRQLDPTDADYWFVRVISCETGGTYDSNAYNPGSTSGKGAYGLYQMNPSGQGNGEYDAGNVAWPRQTTNAINYSQWLKSLKYNPWRYWECAKERW